MSDRAGSGIAGPRSGEGSPGYGGLRGLRNLVLAAFLALAGPASAETVVVALGDSLTAGHGLPADEGFVPRLQAWLDAQGAEAEIRNAGVSGDTTAGGLARLDWALGEDADALVVALGGNDFLRGIDPAESRANLRDILAAAEARGLPVLLIGIDASGQYGPDYEAAFDGMYPDLAEEFGTLLERDFFAGLLEGAEIAAARAEWLQPDGLHPNAAGVERIVERLGPSVLELVERAQ